jgi:hypothetical protein
VSAPGAKADASASVLHIEPATHRVVDALLPWFVNGTLSREELAFVQGHLAECEHCRREIDWLRELHAACAAAAAAPGSAPAVRHLRRRLEEPRSAGGIAARLRALAFPLTGRFAPSPGNPGASARPDGTRWPMLRSWPRAVMAAQLAVILVLGTVLVANDAGSPQYRTLGATGPSAPVPGALVVVFDPAATELDLRRVLRTTEARIVDGPTQANAYILDVPAERLEQALRALKSERIVVLAEPLGPGRSK